MSFIAQDFDNLNIITILKGRNKLSSEITFFATIELSDVASKSLLWICLAFTMTWLNSFAFKFLGLRLKQSPQTVSLPEC